MTNSCRSRYRDRVAWGSSDNGDEQREDTSMKEDNIVQDKSDAFAPRIVQLCRYPAERKRECVLPGQLLSSGTSIGTNGEEAIGAHSRPDFLAKLTIAYKEVRESRFCFGCLETAGTSPAANGKASSPMLRNFFGSSVPFKELSAPARCRGRAGARRPNRDRWNIAITPQFVIRISA
jgi:four helix bundle protein